MLGIELLSEVERLEAEAKIVYRQLVLPNWGGSLHGFADTLYGYMMGAFARVDLVSALWRGTFDKQTERMVLFMDKYLAPNHEANSVAVQMWRHKLMHTTSPRALRDPGSGRVYRWLLHWAEHLPKEQHYQFQLGSSDRILNIGLLYLLGDLKAAISAYLTDLQGEASLQANYQAVMNELQNYEFRPV